MKAIFGLVSAFCAALVSAADFPAIYNSQVETIPFTKPGDALAGMHLPDGFHATLFASEPDVQQPIGFTTDSRGRLWVVENYTYAERARGFDTNLHDRIIILEDTNGDGRFDKRSVFWDQGTKVTSVLPGFGGAFVLAPPNLLFFRDANGDDVPDGPPQIVLDGFEANAIRHNIANGLKFGPDGWIYGRHGILSSSKVGVPGTPAEQRVYVNAGIWRFHPITKKFEMVAQGTTNPWGHDWDENGQLFMINTVIGHLWQIIPGAYYRRMYGEHPDPYLYELIEQTADHFHWDTREKWSDIRTLGVTGTTSQQGGGHAHSGLLVYNGGNWPAQYKNTALTVNYHGRRLNDDRLEREGATYVGKHNPDLMFMDDPWFRGVDVLSGPDGGVYVSDWSDIEECHDDNGVHRTSGRIYKIVYGNPKSWRGDISKASDDELVKMQLDANEWFVRQARQVLHERAATGHDMKNVHAALHKILNDDPNTQHKLHALWAIYVTGDLDEATAQRLLKNNDEQLRVWAMQLLIDQVPPSDATAAEFASMARSDKSGLVLTYLASAMRKATAAQRLEIARGLVSHKEFADDRVFPLMVWYGIEPEVPKFTREAVALADQSQLPKVRRFITRRIFQDLAANGSAADSIVQLLTTSRSAEFQLDILTGIDEALKGVDKSAAPQSWRAVASQLAKSPDARVQEVFVRLDALFGDGRAADALRSVVADPKVDIEQRRRALATLLQSGAANLEPMLAASLEQIDFAPDAIRALAKLGGTDAPGLLLARYNELKSPAARTEAVNALVSRPTYAARLLDAVQRGAIRRQDITAAQLRELRAFNDGAIAQKVRTIWPQLDESDAGKKKQYARLKALITMDRVARANKSQGRATFEQVCAVCHTLFGEGAKIGPDLTGADRKNIDYLLDNILNPSAIVAETYRVSNVTMKDDRSITGIILNQTDRVVTIQTTSEKMSLAKDHIEKIQPSQLSMMPDGLLENLNDEQVTNLLAYLMSPEQVARP